MGAGRARLDARHLEPDSRWAPRRRVTAAGSPTPETASTTLYLVNPAGGRYAITNFPPSDGGARPKLVDWSGDGGHALLYTTNATRPSAAVTVDLRSGTQTTFPINKGFDVVARYTRPDGKGVLLAKWRDTEPAWLQRVDFSGHHELSYPVAPDFQGSYLSAPDGAQLVLGAAAGLALMGNDGIARKALPIAAEQLCEPTRWWDTASTIVVTRCSDNGLSRLWLVPIDGGPPTALTAPLSGQGPDYGDTNAWQLPAGTFAARAAGQRRRRHRCGPLPRSTVVRRRCRARSAMRRTRTIKP